jgi:RNA polymerase sigma-70 factor (ECF subfamily)
MGGDDEREIDVQSTAAAETDAAPQAPPPLEALFRDHHERVFHAAYRITGDAGDAEDVLQSVFLRLLRRAPEVVGATAGPYLHRAAVNAALDLLRGRRRAPAVALAEVAERLPEPAPRGPEARGRGRELRDTLRDALGRLTPESAEIFVLRYIEGYGNREIAALLELTPTAVAVRLHRTRLRLQQELAIHRGGL